MKPSTGPSRLDEPAGAAGRRRPAAPALTLLAVLAIAFGLLAADPARSRVDLSWLSEVNMVTLAENTSPAHGFASFFARIQEADGVRYLPYHRFPVLGLGVIKLAMLPFPDDAWAKLRAARLLMLGLVAAAAALAWFALRRLIADDWTALAAVLLAFSSFHALYYADMVATDIVIDLFAVMLAFHGAAVFATTGRLGQLLAKTCLALLLGWHVLALVGPLALLGAAAATRRRDWRALRRHVGLGAVALLFAIGVLGVNFAREHALLEGAVPVAELPSYRSMLRRSGVEPRAPIDWPRFAARQLERVGVASLPYPASLSLAADLVARAGGRRIALPLVLVGALALAATLGLVARLGGRGRLPLAALALTGPCWALGMRHTTYWPWHDFEGLFHIGVPIALFALALPRLVGDGRARLAAAGGAAAVLLASAGLMAAALHDPIATAAQRSRAADFDAIRALARNKTVLIPDGLHWNTRTPRHLLSGVVEQPMRAGPADFAVDVALGPGAPTPTLTPRNRSHFLYDRAVWAAAIRRYQAYALDEAPTGRSGHYTVHQVRNQASPDDLLYVRHDCPERFSMDRERRFFLHVHPADEAVLSKRRRPFGFDNLDFPAAIFWRWRGRCFALRKLPDYEIAAIATGQSRRRQTPGQPARWELGWEVRFAPDAKAP